jgi:hypothetical protein
MSSVSLAVKSYAGIGSRETPDDVLYVIERLAVRSAFAGELLRSGGAKGADMAFERGCDSVHGPKEIFRAADCTPEAIALSEPHHPAWGLCSPYAKKLHGRNAMIILGKRLNDPVSLVICWTEGGKPKGGTAQGIRIAEHYGIPVFNLGIRDNLAFAKSLIPRDARPVN